MKLIINPDVHGRTFWKEKINPEDYEIIFLGDYLDPYPIEGITKDDAIENFKEILNLKKKYPNKVTLLLGNHDIHYLANLDECRVDYKNYNTIKNLFFDNYKLFKIAEIREVNGKKYTFSHAPIHKDWRNMNRVKNILGNSDKNLEDLINKLNNLWRIFVEENNEGLITILNIVSWIRGGMKDYGSPIWADVRELEPSENIWPGYYQIFGHTQLRFKAIFDNFACLDCHHSFQLDENGINETGE